MGKLIVDQIQKPGGSAFTLPSAAAAGYLSSDVSGALSVTAVPTVIPNTVVPDDTPLIIGSVISNSARNNVYSTGEWSSSSAWTTYYNSWQDAASRTQGFNMFMGDGYPSGTTQIMYANDGENAMSRTVEYAHRQRIGNKDKDYFYYDNITSNYAGISLRCIPIRNTTNASISRTMNIMLSAYDSTYGGAAAQVYTPDTSVYSTATDAGTWTSLFSGGSNNTTNNASGSIVVPANTTVLLFMTSCHHYETTYRFKDTNFAYNLDTFFDGDLVCDLRMLETLKTSKNNRNTNTAIYPCDLYTTCATVYGDR